MADNVVEKLNGLLADAIVFYHKLHHYHWHVSGPDFYDLHERFEELYEKWAGTIDAVAERVVTLGGRAHPTLAGAIASARLEEDAGCPAPGKMLANVVADLETQLEGMRAVGAAADAAGDRGTAGMTDELIGDIEKRLWMLKAWSG